MSLITFDPWRPIATDPRFQGLRLLVVGESHYDEGASYTFNEQRAFTTEIVKRWGAEAEGYQRFFASIYRTFNEADAAPSSEAFRAFWNSIFFYNYVQSFVPGGARERPTSRQFKDSAEAFHGVLDEVRPEAVVVMSKETWRRMSERDATLLESDEEALGTMWQYVYASGSALVAHTHHPSSYGYSPAAWQPRVARFLEHARTLARTPQGLS